MSVIRQQDRDEVARSIAVGALLKPNVPIQERELMKHADELIDKLIDEIRERFRIFKGLSAIGGVAFATEHATLLVGNTEIQEWFAQAFAQRAGEDRDNLKVRFYRCNNDQGERGSIDISVELKRA